MSSSQGVGQKQQLQQQQQQANVPTTEPAEESLHPSQPPEQQPPASPRRRSVEHAHLQQDDPFGHPGLALSRDILLLYKLINRKYSEERRLRQPGPKYNDGYDDRHGHYVAYVGEEIWGRYTVQGVLGRGSFGTVLKCFDEKHQEQVAAKVIRNGDYFYDQGLIEVNIVARLNKLPALEHLVVRLGKVFVWKSHLVLVFEMLSMNLFQLIQRTNYNGVSLNLTRKFAYQLVLVLKQLEEHDPPIIHCDVKPENVVLRDPSRSSIRLIDFGSACCMQQGAKMYKYVQSRFYRSAEVILELGYDTAIDRWSLGCMLVELHTGIPLFAGKNEMDQLARFTGVLGPLPDDMIERSNKKDLFFYDMGQAQQESYVRPLAARGGSPPLLGHGQQQDLAASPSPVIAAEVLNSLSATSSISAVTAASAVTGGTYSTPAPASTAPQPSLPPAPPTVSEARQSHRNFAITPSGSVGVTCPSNHNNNNTVVAVPALRRPMTAVTMEPSSKKGGIGGKVGGGGGGFSSVGSRTASSRPATSIRKSQKAHVNVITPADSPTTTTTTTTTTTIVVPPVVTPSSLASGGLRQSALTPKPRLTTSNHLLVHGDGTPSSSSKISRAGLQHPQQQQQQQQMGALPSKSPFLLRVQPTPDQCQSLEEIIGVYSGGPRGCRRGQPGHDVEDYKVFLDFIQRLLCYDPRKRMSCTEALQHPFLAELEMQKQWKYLSGGAP